MATSSPTATPPSTGQSFPVARWDLRIRPLDDSLHIRLDDTEFRFEGISAPLARRAIWMMDGRTSPREIAEATGLSDGSVENLLGHLIEHGLANLGPDGAGEAIPSREFFQLTRGLFSSWKDRLFGHPLWDSLATGEATRSQFIGWLIETYHFIEAANQRMPYAVAMADNHEVARMIAHHYKEEYDHADFFLQALEAVGIDSESAIRSRPLPGTQAVAGYMRECARRDCLEYAACSGFLESTGDDRDKAREFYQRLIQHYAPDNPKAVTPMADHTDLDEAYGHGDLFESVCGSLDSLSPQRASNVLQATEGLVETLELWSTDIYVTYEKTESFPRTECFDYRRNGFL